MSFVLVVGILVSLALTILLCIMVLPAKKDGTFQKKFLQFLHNYFNFKNLYLESVLKVIFSFVSIASIVCGVLVATIGNLFNCIGYIINNIDSRFFDFGDVFGIALSNFFGGLVMAILVPVALRLSYEIIMMFILLVKNVIEINNKMKKTNAIEEAVEK